MKSLATLLDSRMFWLQRFLAVSTNFAKRLEGEFSASELELFETNRHTLLKIISELDTEINSCSDQISQLPEGKISFYKLEKARILEAIQATDQAILQQMELVKNQMALKLKELFRGKNALSQYRRSHAPSDRLDKNL